MTKSKNTKRALLMSVLSMMLCIAMLAGSTFAWFTDSVTSGKNHIIAGNLDVELYHKDGDTFKTVESTTDLFSDVTLWEPGAYCYEVFKVSNVGTLALKYQLRTILDTTDGSLGYNTVKDKDNKDIMAENGKEPESLLNALYVKVLDGDANLTERPAYTDGVLLKDYLEGGSTTASALEPGASTTSTVVIYWPESEKDNNWNLQNGKHASDATEEDPVGQLKVLFAVNLIATQYPSEADSFDNQYDADAKVNDDDQITVSSVRGTAKTVAKEETVIVVGSVGNTATSTKVTVSADAIEANKDITLVVEESENSDAVATITTEQGTPLYFDVSLEDETGAAVALAENGCVDIEMNLGKNLKITAVNHRTSALDTDTSKSEYYSYDLNTGILKLHVTSLSPFSVGYLKAVAKVDDVFYTSLNEAVANAASGKTVTLTKDVTLSETINITKDVNLDLNGMTITNDVSNGRVFFVIAPNVMLTIDGTKEGSGIHTSNAADGKTYGIVDMRAGSAGSKLVVNGGTYTGNTDNGALFKVRDNNVAVELNNVTATTNRWIFDTDNSTKCGTTLTVNGGHFTSTEMVTGNMYSVFKFKSIPVDEDNPNIRFTDTTIVSAGGACIDLNVGIGKFNDCNFTVTNASNPAHTASAMSVSNGSWAIINGGSYASDGYGAYVYTSGGNIVINGGATISGKAKALASSAASYYNESGQITLNDGTINGDIYAYNDGDRPADITINGGSVNGNFSTKGSASATIHIYGGLFTADPTKYIDETKTKVTENSDGTWSVVAIE